MTTDWDRSCGFADARSHIAARHVEERDVMAFVGVSHEELGFVPVEYRSGALDAATEAKLHNAVVEAIGNAPAVFLPVGAGGTFSMLQRLLHRLVPPLRPPGGTTPHHDHLALTDLLIEPLLADGREVWLYEDLPYLWAGPGDDRARLLTATHNAVCTEVNVPVDRQHKAAAINRYTSQAPAVVLRPADKVANALPPTERYWRLCRQR